jgi:leader peptidase (prepilin peptidase)/N-methyltransferase
VPSALTLAGAGVGLLLGPWLAVTTVRLAERDPAARATPVRVVATSVLAAAVVAAGPVLAGDRPAAVALAWFGAAALVLADVDLRRHRLPDRVTWPALVGCGVALLADAVVTGEPGAVLRAGVAAVLAAGAGVAARVVSPPVLGRGDVKLLGLLGLVLGWAGWGVLLGGVVAGLLVGALGSVLLIALGRAGWRTRVPFGPPLLVGAYVAMCLAAPLPLT